MQIPSENENALGYNGSWRTPKFLIVRNVYSLAQSKARKNQLKELPKKAKKKMQLNW